jgi:hypothetical protein
VRNPIHTRLLAIVPALVALAAGVAPASAVAAIVTLHVSGHSKLSLGSNTLGVPFFLGVYGETPVVYGTVTDAGPAIANASVDLQFREARNFASAPWKTVCQTVTDANGTFFVRAANCVTKGFTPWHPRRSGGMRAVVTAPARATSRTLGWLIVPDIHITGSTRSANSTGPATYRIGGRLLAVPSTAGTLAVTRVGDNAALAQTPVRGGKAFELAVTLAHSGTEHLRLAFTPRNTADEAQPVSRDLSLRVTVHSRRTTVVAKPAVRPRVPKATLAASLPKIPL